MRPLVSVWLLAVSIEGCATSVTPRSAQSPTAEAAGPAPAVKGRVAMRGGPPIALKGFVARVAPVRGDGECDEHQLTIRGQDLRIVTYTIGAGAVRRRLSLYLNDRGERVRYMETRGDLQLMSQAPTTDMSLDFVRGTAQATNQSAGKIEIATGTLGEALRAKNLGVPEEMIELVEQRCIHKPS